MSIKSILCSYCNKKRIFGTGSFDEVAKKADWIIIKKGFGKFYKCPECQTKPEYQAKQKRIKPWPNPKLPKKEISEFRK